MQSRLLDKIDDISMRHASNIDAINCNYAIAHLQFTTTISWTAWYQFAWGRDDKMSVYMEYNHLTLTYLLSIHSSDSTKR